jgi:predicted NUDIX family NTP pyrophosphohydrolase
VSMKNSAGVLIHRRIRGEVFVLVVQSRGGEVSWGIPKGEFHRVDQGARHSAVREVSEELGIEIDPRELSPLGESVYANKRKRVHCFSWKAKGILKSKLDHREISDARFLRLDEAGGFCMKRNEFL